MRTTAVFVNDFNNLNDCQVTMDGSIFYLFMNSHLKSDFKHELHLRGPLLDQELLTLPELIPVSSVVRVALIFFVVFCGPLFVFSSFILWTLYRLFFDSRVIIIIYGGSRGKTTKQTTTSTTKRG